MRLSHVKMIPNFIDIKMSDKNRTIKISDRTIFREILNENRTLQDTGEPANKGDYVQAVVTCEGQKPKVIHIELGKQHFPAYETALTGCTPQQVFSKKVYGKETEFNVVSVKKTQEMELTDENIEKLQLCGIHSVEDYRKDYVGRNKDQIIERVFLALKRKLMEELDKILEVELVEAEVENYNQNQRDMINNVVGNVEERLIAAYGNNGQKSLEECEGLFKKENTKNYKMIVLGEALAAKNNRQISEEEKNGLLENYKMVYGKSDEEIETENLMENVFEAFYLQYTIKELQNYFESVAQIVCEK